MFSESKKPEVKEQQEDQSSSSKSTTKTTEENAFHLPFGATPLPPELQQRKGRFWNYEKNRWSFCSDESDDEHGGGVGGGVGVGLGVGGGGVGGAGNVNVQKAAQADAKADNKGKPEATIMNFSGPEVKAGQIMKPTTDVVAPQIKEIRLAFVAGEFLSERP